MQSLHRSPVFPPLRYFAYLGTAALYFVETRRALALLTFMATVLALSAVAATETGLGPTQGTIAGSMAGGITWTLFLLGLVWIATRTVNSFHLERETSHQRLEQLIRAKDEFVATVSHELRTPMTAVLGLAQQLHDAGDVFTPDEQQELIGLIVSEAEESAAIIEDLLVAARIEDGNVTIHASTVDLSQEAEAVLKALPGGDTIHHDPSNGALAYADPTRVRQIVRNLVTNALRYGAHPITISTGPGHIAVSDCGPGIPSRDRNRVFQAYGRSGDHHHSSIGLGLAVSNNLAGLMNGDLTYQRTNGESTFHLRLPGARLAEQKATDAKSAHH